MKTLLDEAFAPISSKIGFIEAPLDEVVDYVAAWQRGLNGGFAPTRKVQGTLPELLAELVPLPVAFRGPMRELFVETNSRSTAYFRHDAPLSDVLAPVSHICRVLRKRGAVVSSASMPGKGTNLLARAPWDVSITTVSSTETDWLNLERTLQLSWDGKKLTFHQEGQAQHWESPDRYRARMVRDRFDSVLLETYCRAIGIDVFNPSFYGPNGCVIQLRQDIATYPQRSLSEAQAAHGIIPGAAASVRG